MSITVKLLVTALAAVIISVFSVIQLAPSKAALEEVRAAHNNLVPVVQAIPLTVTSVGSRLDNIINSLAASYATKGEISRLATSDSFTSLSTQVGTFSGDITVLKNDIVALKTSGATYADQIKSLEDQPVGTQNLTDLIARVTALEAKAATTTTTGSTGTSPVLATTGSGITVSIRLGASTFLNWWGAPVTGAPATQLYFLVSANAANPQTSFIMTVTNTTGKPITNLALKFGLAAITTDTYTIIPLQTGSSVVVSGLFPIWTNLITTSTATTANPVYYATGYNSFMPFQVPVGESQYQGYISANLTGTGATNTQVILSPTVQVIGITQ